MIYFHISGEVFSTSLPPGKNNHLQVWDVAVGLLLFEGGKASEAQCITSTYN